MFQFVSITGINAISTSPMSDMQEDDGANWLTFNAVDLNGNCVNVSFRSTTIDILAEIAREIEVRKSKDADLQAAVFEEITARHEWAGPYAPENGSLKLTVYP
jgi:hypothetical protein